MKNNERLYVDVHVLQTVPPSCVNRDDTGSPKTAVYGSVTRARVSSQSWKRAMRRMFEVDFQNEQKGIRTQKLVETLKNEILSICPDKKDVEKYAKTALEAVDFKIKKDNDGKEVLEALFFISENQIKAVAKIAADTATLSDLKKKKEVIKKVINDDPSIDIALFGRMLASNPDLNSEACAQVAHSISTHKVINEYDYFTAIDDVVDDQGKVHAAYLDTMEFNSSTLYRYATVAVHKLNEQLGGDTVRTVKEFVSAFVRSMPDGKQNTFANRTLPDAVLVTVRRDQSVNLVGAFERPVYAGENGYVEPSAKRMCEYAKEVYADFAGEPEASFATGRALGTLAEPCSFTELLNKLGAKLEECIGEDANI